MIIDEKFEDNRKESEEIKARVKAYRASLHVQWARFRNIEQLKVRSPLRRKE